MKVVRTAICEKYDRLCSPLYACQLVFVMNDTAVFHASSGACAASPAGFHGSQGCRRIRAYDTSSMTRLHSTSVRP